MFGKILTVEYRLIRLPERADQLIQFHLHRFTIPILGILDKKNHEKGDDGRACINYQLETTPFRGLTAVLFNDDLLCALFAELTFTDVGVECKMVVVAEKGGNFAP